MGAEVRRDEPHSEERGGWPLSGGPDLVSLAIDSHKEVVWLHIPMKKVLRVYVPGKREEGGVGGQEG